MLYSQDVSYFNPLKDVQEWEVVELSKKVKGPNFPDYHYESNAEVSMYLFVIKDSILFVWVLILGCAII